jgi:hypothetical protein
VNRESIKPARRPGWVRLEGGVAGRWLHSSGWIVRRCGHPTALWPYYAEPPERPDQMLIPGGRAFRLLLEAQACVEAVADGSLELISRGWHGSYRCEILTPRKGQV